MYSHKLQSTRECTLRLVDSKLYCDIQTEYISFESDFEDKLKESYWMCSTDTNVQVHEWKERKKNLHQWDVQFVLFVHFAALFFFIRI